MTPQPPIVYFDGSCGLCSKVVDFLIRRDPDRRLRFAPLQGNTAREHLADPDRELRESVVLTWNSRTYRNSAAVVRILWLLPLRWKLLGTVLWLIPAPLRDWGYQVVARYRNRFLGTSNLCRLPTPEESMQLLP